MTKQKKSLDGGNITTKIKIYGNVKYDCNLRETDDCPFASMHKGVFDDYTCPRGCNDCIASVLNKDKPAFTYGVHNPFGLGF